MPISKKRVSRLTPAERKRNATLAAAKRWGLKIVPETAADEAGTADREPYDKVLFAAAQSFGDRGYAAPSIKQIADAADVGMQTLYRFFPTKRALYVECCRHVFGQYSIYLARLLERNVSPEAKIYAFVLGDCFLILNPNRTRLFHRALNEGDVEVVDSIFRTGAFDAYFNVLAEAVGRLVPAAAIQEKCVTLLALVFGLGNFTAISEILPVLTGMLGDYETLAATALRTIFPDVDWGQVRREVWFEPFELRREMDGVAT